MARPDDPVLLELLARDPSRGWRAFIDHYTPLILTVIERAGVSGRDEAMEVYVLACDRFAENDCRRLCRHDPSKGALSTWVGAIVRHTVVDWVRSQAGRRRLFGTIGELSRSDQRVFEEYYWNGRTVAEISEMVRGDRVAPLGLTGTLDALERVERALTSRQRAELLTFAARRPAVSLTDDDEEPSLVVTDPSPDPETTLRVVEAGRALEAAMLELPEDDRLIVQMRIVDGLTLGEIGRALRLPDVTSARLHAILARLRARLASYEGVP
jgi:DNA-directed RNA polymerase specialized sigma24 family protein